MIAITIDYQKLQGWRPKRLYCCFRLSVVVAIARGQFHVFNTMVKTSDDKVSITSGRGFDSRPGRYQAILVNSAFHPSGVGKSSTGLVGWGYGGARSLVSGGR